MVNSVKRTAADAFFAYIRTIAAVQERATNGFYRFLICHAVYNIGQAVGSDIPNRTGAHPVNAAQMNIAMRINGQLQ